MTATADDPDDPQLSCGVLRMDFDAYNVEEADCPRFVQGHSGGHGYAVHVMQKRYIRASDIPLFDADRLGYSKGHPLRSTRKRRRFEFNFFIRTFII